MKENNRLWLKPVIYLYLVIMTFVVCYFSSKLWTSDLWENERFTIVVISALSFFVFLAAVSIRIKDILHLVLLYHISVVAVVILMLIPYEYRPIMLVFMLITYICGFDTGLVSSICITVATSFLYGAQQEYLYGTLIIGAISCFVAHYVKDTIKFIISVIVFIFTGFFVNGIFEYYYSGQGFGFKFAFISIASSLISLIIFINVYLFTKPADAGRYVKENSAIIKMMKEKSLSLYYHSIEVGELAQSAAKAIDCDSQLAYAGGVLHDIGKMSGKADSLKESLTLANQLGIPREIKSIIVEHTAKHRIPSSKESAIVMLADSVIGSIEYMKASDKEIIEKKIIENVFSVRFNSGALKKSGLTINEYSIIKDKFIEFYNREA